MTSKVLLLKSLMVERIQSLIPQMLPGGRMAGSRYLCGSVHGGEGRSMSVVMTGENAGAWEDYSTGEKGDIIKILYYQNGEDNAKMIEAAEKLTGATSKQIPEFLSTSKQSFKKPKKTWVPLDEEGPVFEYLTRNRKIPSEILHRYEVCEEGDKYVFLFRSPKKGDICLAKFVGTKLDGNGKKTVTASKDGLWCLWGMHQKDHTYDDSYVIVCEGEIDAMSWASQGFHAVSVPGGAGNLKWIETSYDWLSKYKRIYISFDSDSAGTENLEEIQSRLGISKTSIIRLPKKDANECIKAGMDLKQYFDNAEDATPVKFVGIDALRDEMWEKISRGRREEQGLPFMGWEGEESIGFRLRPRELTIYTGHPGHGKSALLYQLAAYLIGVHGKKVAIASLEEPASDIANLIMFNLAGEVLSDPSTRSEELFNMAMDAASGHLFLYHHIGVAPIDDIIEWSKYCVGRHGAEHIIIDSVAKTNLDIEDNKDANLFVEKITSSMNETGAHYSLVAHSRKGDTNSIGAVPTESDIKGSVQFSISAFNIITVWKNTLKANLIKNGETKTKDGRSLDETWGDGMIRVCKQKVGGIIGEYKTWYDLATYRLRRQYHKNEQPYTQNNEQ